MDRRRILNVDEVDYHAWGHGERFQARLGRVSARLGARKLGYNVTVLPPGKRAFPFHSHRVNEEMFFVLSGEGEVRIGEDRHRIRRGDVIACPPGGPETAHQIINTSSGELSFLAVSTRESPDLVDYPDSGKYGVAFECAPEPGGKAETLRFIVRDQATADDYWDGE